MIFLAKLLIIPKEAIFIIVFLPYTFTLREKIMIHDYGNSRVSQGHNRREQGILRLGLRVTA